ncbi:MAG: hypothetical protein LT082_13110 [Comamonas sp.]|nr:hypothetical protein [Comamonas sp.]
MHAHRLRSRGLAWLLLLALVVAQWLGLAHGVLHARAELAGEPATQGALRARPAAPVLQRHAWLGDLYGAHDRAGECRLYDQLASGGHAPPMAQPALPPACAPALPPCWVQRSWAAAPRPLFQARGPPARA